MLQRSESLFFCALALGALLASAPGPARADQLAALAAAASGGDAGALFELGDRYERGEDVEQDFGLAGAYMRLAAQRGHPAAQYRLGLYRVAGLDAGKDLQQGYVWLSLAAGSDGVEALAAGALRERLASMLPDTDLARAKSQIAGFEAVTGPATLPDPRAMMLAVRHHLPSSDCAPAAVSRDAQGALRVRQFVRRGGPRYELTPPAKDYFEQQSIQVSAVELDEDLCPVVDVLASDGAVPREASRMRLRDETGRATTTFPDGAYVVVDLPGFDEDRYLTVDFFLQDGYVVHMFPNAASDRHWLRAGEPLLLGDPARSEKSWQVGPPFGSELIVVLSSSEPIYDGLRKEVEQTTEYLAVLRERLAGAAAGTARPVSAHFEVVQTRPRLRTQ